MPHFLGGHICPKMSKSFPVSVLGASGSVRRQSSVVPLSSVQPETWGSCSRSQGGSGGSCKQRLDGGRQRPAPARGSGYSGLSRGAGPPCPSVPVCAEGLDTFRNPTPPTHRSTVPLLSSQGLWGGGLGVARSGPRGLWGRGWPLCCVCCGPLPWRAPAAQCGGPATGVAEPSDSWAGPVGGTFSSYSEGPDSGGWT